jgi:hypothetical protein
MSAAVFDARWNRLQKLRDLGYEELTDFLGRRGGLGSLVRLGLLRKREEGAVFQRYHGYVPTEAGEEFLLHVMERELVLVKPEKSATLFLHLDKDPYPNAPFKDTYAEPTLAQFQAVEQLKLESGRDLWKLQRAEELHTYLLKGYMDLRAFTKRTGAGEGMLLRAGLCAGREERTHDRSLHLQVTPAGEPYLLEVDAFGLLLVRPGMELPLFAQCDPEAAEYWCNLP